MQKHHVVIDKNSATVLFALLTMHVNSEPTFYPRHIFRQLLHASFIDLIPQYCCSIHCIIKIKFQLRFSDSY